MQRSHGESTDPEGLEQDTDNVLSQLRALRAAGHVGHPLRPTRAWSRPRITGFDPVKAKRAYDAWQRVRDAYRAADAPAFKAHLAEFNQRLEDFFTA